MIRNYAVIPTANRPEVCLQAIESIRDQVDNVVIVDNGTEKRLTSNHVGSNCLLVLLLDWHEPPNLSKFWNCGLEIIHAWFVGREKTDAQWNVAIINDDAVVPPGWIQAVSTRMREYGAAAACSGSPIKKPWILTEPGPVGLWARMQGWAFVLAGEKGLRFDEDLAWWFGDDDMDWRCRQAGGMLMVPGYPVVNQFPNGQMTPELQEQASRDRATFEAKWRMAPW